MRDARHTDLIALHLKVDVHLENGTYYVIFSDNTGDFPFPARVENRSEVSVHIRQLHTRPRASYDSSHSNVIDQRASNHEDNGSGGGGGGDDDMDEDDDDKYAVQVRPGQVCNYAWDEPIGEHKLLMGVRGGTSEVFDFDAAPSSSSALAQQRKDLYYERLFYIAFVNTTATTAATTATNTDDESSSSSSSMSGAESQQAIDVELDEKQLVVLSVKNRRVLTAKKESGNRDQLWQMTNDGLIVHEGSSPPIEPMAAARNHAAHYNTSELMNMSNRYVLDIEDMAARPNHNMPLTLRLPDLRRKNTQTWTFVNGGASGLGVGLLCCKVPNMCLQIAEMRGNARVYLGPANQR